MSLPSQKLGLSEKNCFQQIHTMLKLPPHGYTTRPGRRSTENIPS
ncbi:4499_t:CDS:2 [Paraglomus occultum]|uniref:4499_t:CDS:1 n=1 Tax=Paraglomus occultum TaxID=144539 RepID=A0A9N9FUQ9_9GLOM|nr:4499_t:CDS:2 [Paraglomus occultum]